MTGRVQRQFAVELTRRIPYRFICDECGKDSGWLDLTFSSRKDKSQPIKRKVTFNITSKEQEKLQFDVDSLLNAMINKQRMEVESGVYRLRPELGLPAFNDTCIYCLARQGWGRNGDNNTNKPDIIWDYEELDVSKDDCTHNEEQIKLTATHEIDRENINIYSVLSDNHHMNLENVLSVSSDKSSNAIVVQEKSSSEPLSKEMKSMSVGVLDDILMQLCDVAAHLKSLEPSLGFIGLEVDDIVVSSQSQMKISNLKSIQLYKNDEDVANTVACLIRQFPKKFIKRYSQIISLHEEGLMTMPILYDCLIDINSHKKSKVIFLLIIAFFIVSIFFVRLLRF